MNDIWNSKDAKNRFGKLVDLALKEGPQVVTRQGKKVVVVLAYAEYERMTRPDSGLVQFLLSPPWAGSELTFERDRSFPRDMDIEQCTSLSTCVPRNQVTVFYLLVSCANVRTRLLYY